MPRFAVTLFATILCASSWECVQSAELDPFGPATAASPSSPGLPSSVPKKREHPAGAKRPAPPDFRDSERVAAMYAEPAAATAARVRIESELCSTTQFDYLDMALKDVIDDITLRHGFPLVLDRRSLEEAGIDTRTPVTATLTGTTLRSALRLVLRDLDLTYIIRDEVLVITTSDVAESQLSTRFYPVPANMPSREDLRTIASLLTVSVAPETWDAAGGKARANYLPELNAWAVSQQDDIFPEIDGFFAAVLRLSEQASRKP